VPDVPADGTIHRCAASLAPIDPFQTTVELRRRATTWQWSLLEGGHDMAIPWTPALAIGVSEIDHQHKELFLRIEQLVQGVSRGNATDVERLLEFLGQYVVKHFGAEERWMLRSAYPDYVRHKAEHERFIRDYEHMTQEFREKGPNVLVGIRMNNWIAEWLMRHISRSDMELGRFLATKVAGGDLDGP
jgi:hemerythrin